MNKQDMARFWAKVESENWDNDRVWIALKHKIRTGKRDGTITVDEIVSLKAEALRRQKWRDARKDGGSKKRSEWTTVDKQQRFFAGIRSRYGLTEREYMRMLVDQDSACKCCATQLVLFAGRAEAPVVDHCHATGKVRALLCSRCNSLVGRVETAGSEILQKARAFVDSHKILDDPPVLRED